MEEEDNIGLTAWDNLTTTTDGTYLVAGSSIQYNSYVSWSTSYNIDFKVPEVFLKVVKKTIPNVKNLLLLDSNITLSQYGKSDLNRIESVKINLMVILNEESSDNYADKLIEIFSTMFPAYGFVTLNIIQFDFENNNKFDELMELFG
jgi:hypothetical protein